MAHYPHDWVRSDAEDKLLPGIAEFYKKWPQAELLHWPAEANADDGSGDAELALPTNEGGNWTGIESSSIDSFPFVGAVPGRAGHVVAAGFNGHGMPRILLSTAHITPLVLAAAGVAVWTPPALVAPYPPLPAPFLVTAERVAALQTADAQADYDDTVRAHEESARKPFCNEPHCFAGLGPLGSSCLPVRFSDKSSNRVWDVARL